MSDTSALKVQIGPDAYMPQLEAAAAKHGVPLSVLRWVGQHESGFNPSALGPPTSHGRGEGMMQFMPGTAAHFHINPFDPAQAIDAAAAYLRQLYDQTGSWNTAVERYGTFSTGRGASADAKVRGEFLAEYRPPTTTRGDLGQAQAMFRDSSDDSAEADDSLPMMQTRRMFSLDPPQPKTEETPALPPVGELPGQMHLDASLAPQVPEGAPRPFAPGEWLENPNGSWSSEISATVQDPNLNAGQPTNIPTLWQQGGKPVRVSEDTAVDYARQSGLHFRSYPTLPEADKASQDREAAWQNVQPQNAGTVPPLYEPTPPAANPPSYPAAAPQASAPAQTLAGAARQTPQQILAQLLEAISRGKPDGDPMQMPRPTGTEALLDKIRNNPVGTERLNDQQLTNPSPGFDPMVGKNLAGQPMTASAADAQRERNRMLLTMALGFSGGMRALPEQAVTSAETSINQVPGLFKAKHFEAAPGSRNLDIGGGKYDTASTWLKENKGVENHVYDPFNRPEAHNDAVLDAFEKNPADTVTANNVLNVIREPEARAAVIQSAFDYLKPGGKAYFDIYERSGSGAGEATSKGWQNNMRAGAYLDEVRQIFPTATVKGSTIVATKLDPAAPSPYAVRNPSDVNLPQPAKQTGVGKQIGGHTYVHKSAVDSLPAEVQARIAATDVPFDYQIVKYNPKTGVISLLESADWDAAAEPTVGRSLVIKPDGTTKLTKAPADPWIYHHKHLFVRDDYPGFDVNASRQRSADWLRLQGVDTSRIGKKSFWEEKVLPFIPGRGK